MKVTNRLAFAKMLRVFVVATIGFLSLRAKGPRRRIALVFGAAILLTACDSPESKLIDNASRALDAAGQSEGYVRVGTLFGRDVGVFCIILGELDEVHFSDAVPLTLRGDIVRRIGMSSHHYEGLAAHVFDGEGHALSTWSLHWRNPRLYVGTPDGRADRDACFGPSDRVHVDGSPTVPMAIIYSLEANAHD